MADGLARMVDRFRGLAWYKNGVCMVVGGIWGGAVGV